jgi:hypothetical protein
MTVKKDGLATVDNAPVQIPAIIARQHIPQRAIEDAGNQIIRS